MVEKRVPGFSVSLTFPRAGAKEASNLEMPIDIDQKGPNKSYLSLIK
jgi:hypothetical protein